MAKTKGVLEFFLPTSSFARINDAIEEVRKVLEKHRGTDFFITYSGPFPDDTRGDNGGQSEHRRDVGRSGPGRDEADNRARDDFEDEAGDGADEPAEPVKRKRGRPPGSGKRAEASGSSSGQSGRGEGSGRSGEGDRGNERRRADEGAGEGRGEGEGRSRGAGADRGAERRDPEQTRVKASQNWDEDGPDNNTEEGADWWAKTPGDEWPDHLMPKGDLDKAMMGEILSQHFEQSGDRAKTLAVLKEATGESSLPNVHPDDYDKAARALLKDAARIEYGVKR